MRSNVAQQVLAFVKTQRKTMIDLLRGLVQAESPSSYPESHHKVRSVLRASLEELGFNTTETGANKGTLHVYASPRERVKGAPAQLVVGHFDTVWALGTLDKQPFSVDGDIIRGPGTFDMKGGLAQLIIALKALQTLRLRPVVTPVIFVNADEEIGSRTSTDLIRRLARRAERAFILEPALGDQGKIKTERKGIGRFVVTVFGKAAHAGLDPASGASAILELSHVIQKLFALNDPDNGVTVNVGTVDGGVHPNVIAPHSTAVVDVRVPTNAAGDYITKNIHAIRTETAGVRLRIEGGIGRPSMEPTLRNQALWRHAQRLGSELGLDLQSAKAGGGSDGNTTSQYTATLDGLGPVGDGAHAEHEFLYIDKSLERAALLAMLLLSPSLEARQKAVGA